MPGTRVTQVRQPVSTDAGTKYQIVAQCTYAGTLPSSAIFLFSVTQDSDPKNDSFERIADAADFTDYGTNREASISNNTRLYRATTVSLNYDDIVSANGAAREFTSRINELVTSYDTYIEAFLTAPEGTETLFPTASEGVKAELVAAYEARLTDITAAETARDAGQRECDQKVAELASLQARLTEAQSDLASVVPIRAAADALVPTYASVLAQISSNKNAIRTTNAGSSASAGDKSVIEAQLVAIEGALASQAVANTSLTNDVQIPLATLVGNLQARVADLIQQVNAKQLEVNACHLEGAELQAAVDLARKQRDAALAAIRAVCPDYNPTTYADGTLAASLSFMLGGAP